MKNLFFMSKSLLLVTIISVGNLSAASGAGPSHRKPNGTPSAIASASSSSVRLTSEEKADRIRKNLDIIEQGLSKPERTDPEQQEKLYIFTNKLDSMSRQVDSLLPQDQQIVWDKMVRLHKNITAKALAPEMAKLQNYSRTIGNYERRPTHRVTLENIAELEASFIKFQNNAMKVLQKWGNQHDNDNFMQSSNQLFIRIEELKRKAEQNSGISS